jgi:hypothetical protein
MTNNWIPFVTGILFPLLLFVNLRGVVTKETATISNVSLPCGLYLVQLSCVLGLLASCSVVERLSGPKEVIKGGDGRNTKTPVKVRVTPVFC